MIENITKRHFLLMMVLYWNSNYVYSVKWNDKICTGDNMMITFSQCCGNEPYCSSNTNESGCNDGEVGLYCEWIEAGDEKVNEGKCVPRTDERSDVCCRGGAVKDACHSVAYKMECPKDWLVNKGCCPDAAERKYNKILEGIPDDMDCCNSPCTQVEKAISSGASNCTLSARCAPGPRTYAMTYDPYNTLGFFHNYREHGSPHAFGNIIHGSGYDDAYGHEEYEHDENNKHEDKHSKHGDSKHDKNYDHVDEITVDDLFELMIEALQDDTDVKSYDAEYYTDSYLGKTKSGGSLADFDLPDPDYLIDMLYGSPYGIPYDIDNIFKNPLNIYSSPYPYDDVYNQHASPFGYSLNPYNSPYGGLGGGLSYGHNQYNSPHGGIGEGLNYGHNQYNAPYGGLGGQLNYDHARPQYGGLESGLNYDNSSPLHGGFEGGLNYGPTIPQSGGLEGGLNYGSTIPQSY